MAERARVARASGETTGRQPSQVSSRDPLKAAGDVRRASVAEILFLQQTVGNAAVGELLAMQRQAAVLAPPAPPAAAPRPRTTMTGSHPTLRLGSHGAAVEE